MTDPHALRREYLLAELRRKNLNINPFLQFQSWFEAAVQTAEISEPNAMTLSTASASGRVSARIVLLKDFDETGFIFFTNYHSDKARQLEENSLAALHFAWLPLERQILIQGRAEKVSREQSARYFASRPLASQLGAWASAQSSPLPSRETLDQAYEEAARRFSGSAVPLPDFWGGYRIVPDTFEYWQGRSSRLHDRFRYSLSPRDNTWRIERLSP